jgi:hypothetical protein
VTQATDTLCMQTRTPLYKDWCPLCRPGLAMVRGISLLLDVDNEFIKYVCVCVCVCVHVCVHVCVCVCMHVCVHVCVNSLPMHDGFFS